MLTEPANNAKMDTIEPNGVRKHEDGQFDDAVEDVTTTPIQPGSPTQRPPARYIDEEHLLEWSDPEDSDEDELEEVFREDDYEDNRVEDEDWEIAERGEFRFGVEVYQYASDRAIRFHKTVQPTTTTCCCQDRKCSQFYANEHQNARDSTSSKPSRYKSTPNSKLDYSCACARPKNRR